MFVINTNNYDFNNPFLKVCAETSGGWIFPNIKEYYAIDEKGHKKQVEPFAIKSVDKYDFQNDIFWGESKGDLPNLKIIINDILEYYNKKTEAKYVDRIFICDDRIFVSIIKNTKNNNFENIIYEYSTDKGAKRIASFKGMYITYLELDTMDKKPMIILI